MMEQCLCCKEWFDENNLEDLDTYSWFASDKKPNAIYYFKKSLENKRNGRFEFFTYVCLPCLNQGREKYRMKAMIGGSGIEVKKYKR